MRDISKFKTMESGSRICRGKKNDPNFFFTLFFFFSTLPFFFCNPVSPLFAILMSGQRRGRSSEEHSPEEGTNYEIDITDWIRNQRRYEEEHPHTGERGRNRGGRGRGGGRVRQVPIEVDDDADGEPPVRKRRTTAAATAKQKEQRNQKFVNKWFSDPRIRALLNEPLVRIKDMEFNGSKRDSMLLKSEFGVMIEDKRRQCLAAMTEEKRRQYPPFPAESEFYICMNVEVKSSAKESNHTFLIVCRPPPPEASAPASAPGRTEAVLFLDRNKPRTVTVVVDPEWVRMFAHSFHSDVEKRYHDILNQLTTATDDIQDFIPVCDINCFQRKTSAIVFIFFLLFLFLLNSMSIFWCM